METTKDTGKPRKTQGNQERHRKTKKDTGKPRKLGINNNYEFETKYAICAKLLAFLKVIRNNTSTTYTPYFSPATRSDNL